MCIRDSKIPSQADIADAKSISIDVLIQEMESIVLSGTKINLDFCVEQYLDDDQQDDLKDYFLNSEIDNVNQCILDLSEEFDEVEIRLYRIKSLQERISYKLQMIP